MGKQFSPKRLQRMEKFEDALNYFVKRYRESLEKGDRYLSALYLDEVAQTLILMKKEKMSHSSFKSKIFEIISPSLGEIEKKQERLEEFEEDLEIVLQKRFPKTTE